MHRYTQLQSMLVCAMASHTEWSVRASAPQPILGPWLQEMAGCKSSAGWSKECTEPAAVKQLCLCAGEELMLPAVSQGRSPSPQGTHRQCNAVSVVLRFALAMTKKEANSWIVKPSPLKTKFPVPPSGLLLLSFTHHSWRRPCSTLLTGAILLNSNFGKITLFQSRRPPGSMWLSSAQLTLAYCNSCTAMATVSYW